MVWTIGCPAHWWMSGGRASKGSKEGQKGKVETVAKKDEGHALSLGSAAHKRRDPQTTGQVKVEWR